MNFMILFIWESPCSLINLNMKKILKKNSLSHLGLFSFCAALVLITSCKRPENEIGLDLQPEDDLLSTYYTDTVEIQTSSVRMDSLKSSGTSSVVLGNYYDPIFGHTRASVFTQVRLSTNGIPVPELYEVDSVVLSMVYTGNYYGSISSQYFSVFEMSDTLYASADTAYYTNSYPAFDSSVNLVDPGKEVHYTYLDEFVIDDGDSLLPQLRIPLRKELGERFFSEDPDSTASNTIFRQYFEGLHIRSETDDAACVNVDLNHSQSRITIYYRDLSGTEEDTLEYLMAFGTLAKKFTHFEHQYTPASLYKFDSFDTIPGQQKCYIQAAAGIMTKVEFPELTEYNEYQGRAVNLARLYLPVADESNDKCCNIPDQFLLYGVGDDGAPEALPFNWDVTVLLEPENNRYRINIARWVQEVLDGERPNNGLYIIPVSGSVSVNNAILNGPQFSESELAKNMRLELVFSN